jgi:hypothetical protein
MSKAHTGPGLNAVEEHVAVARLADSARGNGAHLTHSVAVHELAKTSERIDSGLERLRTNGAQRERVAPEQNALRGLFDDPRAGPGGDLGNRQTYGAGAHVKDGYQRWRAGHGVSGVGEKPGLAAGVRRSRGSHAAMILEPHDL